MPPRAPWAVETRTIVRETVERVVVRDEQIQIKLKARAGESTAPGGDNHEPAETILMAPLPNVTVAVMIYRSRRGADRAQPPRPAQDAVLTLARGG